MSEEKARKSEVGDFRLSKESGKIKKIQEDRGTIPHNQVAVNLAAILKTHLRGKGCKVLTSDAKIAVSEQGPFHCADASVTCDERDRTACQFIRYPCLVAEVLSPSTEAVD